MKEIHFNPAIQKTKPFSPAPKGRVMNTDKILDDAREKIAELEHEQWIAWSKNIAETDNISIERTERWAKLWIPYAELTEAQKDQDRIWADKTLALLGTTDIECPDCMGQGSTFIAHPVYCPRCNHSGVLQYPWKVSVTLENGELPKIPYSPQYANGWLYRGYKESQEDMLNAKYRQVVE